MRLHRAAHHFCLQLLLGTSLFSCGGDSQDETTAPTTGPTSADRSKFTGTWAGPYSCPGSTSTHDDKLTIALGTGTLDFKIIIKENTLLPDTVSGSLVTSTRIDVPTQILGGFPGTAVITYVGPGLAYQQSGLGITCGGSSYSRIP